MKRIHRIIAAITAGAVIVGLSVYSILLDNQRVQLQNQVSGFYQGAFESLLTDVDSLKTKLYKLQAASGENQYSALLMDVWRQAGQTESSIAALPVSYQSTSALTQFINRTGDYCRYLSNKLANGRQLTAEEIAQTQSLAKACGDISLKINELWQQGYSSNLGITDTAFISENAEGSGLDFTNQEFPRLIYDGPFSESTENKQPEGLGSSVVTKEYAQMAAGQFLSLDSNALTYTGDLNGTIASYGFSGQQNGIPFTIYISKQGGKMLWYMSQRDTGISASPTDQRYNQLVAIAREYLLSKGYGETAASYAQFYGGMAVINLAPVENGVVLYPDLIKVWVDISANDVAGVDANNYLMSHKTRNLQAPTLTKEDAQAKVNTAISVTNVKLTLIPLPTREEKLCWEFTGMIGENEYLVYINADTGVEENILMIQDTNEGKLVM